MNQIAHKPLIITVLCLLILVPFVYSQLDTKFYNATCPSLTRIVSRSILSAITNETRLAASLLRLHFHDCFVNGCDASVLLDDNDTFTGEKNALPNRNSLRGFELIDTVKSNVENVCPNTVSCADILNLAVREAIYIIGGPIWPVPLGRRDSLTASQSAANAELPSPFEPLANIHAKFAAKGLDSKDVVVLSGAHTIGFARCSTFKQRLFDFDGAGNPDPTLDATLRNNLQTVCPNQPDSDTNMAPLDPVTKDRFDNFYYRNLLNNSGVLQSDQALMTDDTTSALVNFYVRDPFAFRRHFGVSMTKLSSVGVLAGQNNGQIRSNCRVVN